MKKILALSIVLSLMVGTSVLAAQQNQPQPPQPQQTNTEKFVQQHTQKAVDTEKKLQNKTDAKKGAFEQKQQNQQKKLDQKKQKHEDAKKQTQDKINTKKNLVKELAN